MKTLKNIFFLFAILLLSNLGFSQIKTYDDSYQQKMGEALDELSPEQMQVLLENAAKMVEKEEARKTLACIASKLTKKDQEKLLRMAKSTKYYNPMNPPVVATPAGRPAEATSIIGPMTTIEFKEATFDFGEVDQGDKIAHRYKFTNTGSEPLIIKNAKGSCGCTVPKWPKDPIAPGESGEMFVEFDTKGKKGMQAKRVTITANTDPVNTYITIKGKVNVPVKN